jgi:hypothetical protein
MTLKESLGFTVLSLLMPCVLLCLLAGCKTNQPTAAELQPLQGTWEGFMAGNEAHGKYTIKITGNSLQLHRDTNFWFETTLHCPQALTHSSYTPQSKIMRHLKVVMPSAKWSSPSSRLTVGH